MGPPSARRWKQQLSIAPQKSHLIALMDRENVLYLAKGNKQAIFIIKHFKRNTKIKINILEAW